MKKYFLYSLACFLTFPSCEKVLETKPSSTLSVLSGIKEAQAVLDAYNLINFEAPGAGEMSADDYYMLNTEYNIITNEGMRRTPIWQKDYLFNPGNNDWYTLYRVVYYSNSVLEAMLEKDVPLNELQEKKNICGQAFFWRAYAFQKAASIWAMVYDPAVANKTMGIPLRLTADFNVPSVRSTSEETYQQIVSDLKKAIALLPVTPVHVMRPSKPAAYALLARTYLYMGEYVKAGLYADSSLQLQSSLMDLNTLTASGNYFMPKFNVEVLHHTIIQPPNPLANSQNKIDSNLYKSYAQNDLRRTLWFRAAGTGMVAFFGSYDGTGNLFSGPATDEMYLTRAECFARNNNVSAAMSDLNAVLIKRWKTGTFTPLTASTPADALDKIITERRKELLMRDLRWMDIKRYNRDGAGISLKRTINGITYTLPANDLRFALPIPEDIIALTGMPQNPR